jgi:hypothetical protein
VNGFATKSRAPAATRDNRSGLRPSLMMGWPGGRYGVAGFGASTGTSPATLSLSELYS